MGTSTVGGPSTLVISDTPDTIRTRLIAAADEIDALKGRLGGAYALRDDLIIRGIEEFDLPQRQVAGWARITQQRVLAILAGT